MNFTRTAIGKTVAATVFASFLVVFGSPISERAANGLASISETMAISLRSEFAVRMNVHLGGEAFAAGRAGRAEFINMILLKQPFTYSAAKLEKEIASFVGAKNVSVKTQGKGKDAALIVTLAGQPFAIVSVDHPIPSPTFTVALKSISRPKNAQSLIAEHKAHVLISPLTTAGNMGQAVTTGVNLMQLSAIISQLSSPLAHFWSTSEILIADQGFVNATLAAMDAMKKQSSGKSSNSNELPAQLWVNYQLYSGTTSGTHGGMTQGLSSLTGYELDIAPLKWRRGDILQRLFGTVQYLFQQGPVLKDGQSLGASETEKFRIKSVAAKDNRPARLVLTLE